MWFISRPNTWFALRQPALSCACQTCSSCPSLVPTSGNVLGLWTCDFWLHYITDVNWGLCNILLLMATQLKGFRIVCIFEIIDIVVLVCTKLLLSICWVAYKCWIVPLAQIVISIKKTCPLLDIASAYARILHFYLTEAQKYWPKVYEVFFLRYRKHLLLHILHKGNKYLVKICLVHIYFGVHLTKFRGDYFHLSLTKFCIVNKTRDF